MTGLRYVMWFAEVLIAALVECIQGHDIDWSEAA